MLAANSSRKMRNLVAATTLTDTEEIWPVERIATKLVALWGEAASWIRDSRPACMKIMCSGWMRARPGLNSGWKPRLGIETALEWTVSWYRAWKRGDDLAELSGKQIAQYERLARCDKDEQS